MVREKIKISKIEKAAARQATFSKRRRGLFKKAQELAILCDVDVGVIVFSAKGKLYEFSSISMDGIIRKYRLNPNDGIDKSDHPCLKMQLKNTRHESLGNELLETGLQLRQLNGEDIEGLTQNELIHLEKMLENGLSLVLDRKGEKVMEEIRGLQNKVAKLMEENELLRNQVMELSKGKEQVAFGVPGRIWLDNRQYSISVNITSNSRNGRESVNREDTSLKLGLPFNYERIISARYSINVFPNPIAMPCPELKFHDA